MQISKFFISFIKSSFKFKKLTDYSEEEMKNELLYFSILHQDFNSNKLF